MNNVPLRLLKKTAGTPRELYSFQNRRHPLTAADTQCGKPKGMIVSDHFIHQGQNDAGAGTSDGMADGDAAS